MIGLLLGCGLRRSETVNLRLDQLQSRQNHWVIVDMEHVLARGLEGKKIRLKNNKLRLSAALHRAIHNSISQNGLAGYLRRCTHLAS